jgi:hypothetical protein
MDDNISIPLSSEINDLNDNYNDIDLDEIISNQVLYDNYFIQDIMNNCDFHDKESIPYFHNIIKIYSKNIYNNLYPKNCNNKIIVLITRVIHLLGIIYLLLGCLSPRKTLKYHVIFCIKTLILWEFFENKCYMSMFIQKISNLNKCPNFFPEDIKFSKKLILCVMFISIIGIIVPDFSLYIIIYNIVDYLKKYD